jgi:UPF0755 protein
LLFSPVITGHPDDRYEFTIKPGTSFGAVVDELKEQDLSNSTFRIKLSAWSLGAFSKVKAGHYDLKGKTSAFALVEQLMRGRVKLIRVTIPEGKHARQIAGILKRNVEIDSAQFMSIVGDSVFAKQLGVYANSLEGHLYPDTYYFHQGIDAKDVIMAMLDEFHTNFPDSFKTRARQINFSPAEVLTLASIIEGEAVVPAERKIISGVYHNRLKRKMRLQADPTIQYIIKGGPRRLLNKDLEIDSPYNTYKYSGLPPGPIGNPGRAAIEACLYPADVSYLYFVANGDGSHTFSNTLREHNRAKARFDRYRRNIKRAERTSKKQNG